MTYECSRGCVQLDGYIQIKKKFNSFKSLEQHMNDKHGGFDFECCGEKFEKYEDLQKHKLYKHTPIRCPHCVCEVGTIAELQSKHTGC